MAGNLLGMEVFLPGKEPVLIVSFLFDDLPVAQVDAPFFQGAHLFSYRFHKTFLCQREIRRNADAPFVVRVLVVDDRAIASTFKNKKGHQIGGRWGNEQIYFIPLHRSYSLYLYRSSFNLLQKLFLVFFVSFLSLFALVASPSAGCSAGFGSPTHVSPPA